jgi:hypothetical protein
VAMRFRPFRSASCALIRMRMGFVGANHLPCLASPSGQVISTAMQIQ